MNPESPLVNIEEVMNEIGLTKRQIRFDITHDYLPGYINHRNQIVIRREGPDSWNAFLRGEWLPAQPGSHKVSKLPQPEANEGRVGIFRRLVESDETRSP